MSFRRRYYRGRTGKYSNETVSFNTQLTSTVDGGNSFPNTIVEGGVTIHGIPIVAATNLMGNRKVKNFTIKVTANRNDDQIFGALVYVPEGTLASSLGVTGVSQSLYEPNQNVIATFIIPPNCDRNVDSEVTHLSAPTQITVSNRLARNLSTGDYLVLVFSSPNGVTASEDEPVVISGTVNYAIKF